LGNNKKLRLPIEALYLVAACIMAVGVSCIARSDMGYSVITAPVYLVYKKLEAYISFGTAEYLFQGVLLIFTCLITLRVKFTYLFTFVYAVLYGFLFDGCLFLVGLIPVGDGLVARIVFFVVGTLIVSFGVALFLRTYLPPAAYELCVREVSARYHFPQGTVKWVYDGISFALALLLSFVLFGNLEGIGVGTIVSALCNAPLIALAGKLIDRTLDTYVALPRLEKFFEGHAG
jgi:uncharacterized membrane protein YczE